MRSVSLQEAAMALGISETDVRQRLRNGQLRGIPGSNPHGAPVWRVRVNAEILAAITNNPSDFSLDVSAAEFQTAEVIDVEDIGNSVWDNPAPWREVEVQRLELLVDKMLKPLLERIENQSAQIQERDRLLEEKDLQLRLLPDLRKQMEHESRQAAERAQELGELRCHITELEQQNEAKTAKLKQMSEMENQIESLNKTIESLNRPWWKKLFAK